MKIKEITLLGFCTALLFVAQIALAPLANVELVSLLVLLYAMFLGKKVFYIIYGFALLEGVFYSFGVWWIMYLYVWTVLAFFVFPFKKERSSLFWAIVSGIFGLLFGALCSIPYFFIGGFSMGFAYWVNGIPFDILHGISNFIIALLLFRPLSSLFSQLSKSI